MLIQDMTWLAAFVDHHLVDGHRKQHGEASLDEISAAVQSPDPGPDAKYLKAERKAILRQAIVEGSENDRQLFDLLRDDTLTTAEIAKALGWKPKDVPWRKQRAFKRLRRARPGALKTISKK